jgi:lysine 2,3-aminomutase
MDLVGNDTLQVLKYKFETKQNERWDLMLDYLRRTPQVRDVVVSGGDMANVPVKRLEAFVLSLMDIDNVRDIRIATKGLMGIPQHFLQDDVREAFGRMGARARERGVDIALHTHVNAAQSVTPLVAEAAQMVLDAGFRDVRNQGVLLRGVNTTVSQLLELCFTLLDHGRILPYYFYMCDMIPNAEHWRTSLAETQELQYGLLGYMPGFATPRMVCDVPFVGKRWVHMNQDYDRVRGVSHWTKNYRTGIEDHDPDALTRRYHYYDPIYTLPEDGQEWWRAKMREGLDALLEELAVEQGIAVDA